MHWHWRRRDGLASDWHYHCSHQRWCTSCGKILKARLDPPECPDYTTNPPAASDAVKAG